MTCIPCCLPELGSRLIKSGAGNKYQRVAAAQYSITSDCHPLSLSVAGVPIAIALSYVHSSHTLYSGLTILRRPTLRMISSSTKLAAAQSELQTCETHLAAKERELAIKRCTGFRDGLGVRIRALTECGGMWSEVGKRVLRVLEELETDFPGMISPPFYFIYTTVSHETEHRRSSIIHQSPPNKPRECDNTTATRPSPLLGRL